MFEDHEVELIMDALDALQSKQASDSILMMAMGTMLLPTEEARTTFLDEQKQKKEEAQQEQQALKERIILLKAKLIGLKDKAVVESALTA